MAVHTINSLQANYPRWHQQPLRLTLEEIDHPMLVLDQFFSGYHLPDARACLKQWLDDAMHARDIHTANHLTLYDDIEKLVEAAWLLYSRNKQATTKPDNTALQAIIQLLVTAMQPERIFLLHHTPGTLIDLLIVMPDTARTRFSDYDMLIRAVCTGYEAVNFSVHQSSAIQQHIAQGNLFYSIACSSDKVVYDNGKTTLPEAQLQLMQVMMKEARKWFATGMATANNFLEGAGMYYDKEKWAMAAFMLHQAAELTYRAAIYALTGNNIKEHSLYILQRSGRRCMPELNAVLLGGGTTQEEHLLQVLEKAYREARYSNDYQVAREDIALLLERVQQLQETAAGTFEERMANLGKK